MVGPHWKWEINPNTLVSILTLVGVVAGAGVIYQSFNSADVEHTRDIGALEVRTTRMDAEIRLSHDDIKALDYRMTSVEGTAKEAIIANRELAETLNELKSDLKVSKEILQRLEATANRNGR